MAWTERLPDAFEECLEWQGTEGEGESSLVAINGLAGEGMKSLGLRPASA
jgi:hypothetical protein